MSMVSFKSIKVLQMRESLSNGFRKRKLDHTGKRHFHTVAETVNVEVGQWVGL